MKSLALYIKAAMLRKLGKRAELPPTIVDKPAEAPVVAVKPIIQHPVVFFEGVRRVTGKLTQQQVDSINEILLAGSHWPLKWMAYGLGTAWHESKFVPQAEWGRGKGRTYGAPGKYGQPQYGRGFVQLTWDTNYEWADAALDLKGRLLADFDLALKPDIAARILVKGMEEGAFTGKKLADYITAEKADYVGARRIVNGTDKAYLIAEYANDFEKALKAGGYG